MGDYSNLPVSDGTGDAALMHVDADRVIGSHTLSVDSVSNVPAGNFIATVGTLLANGFIDPSTKIDFFGHLDGSDLAIDAFCPGSTDNGNQLGQVVVLKPNTDWANLVAQFIMNATGFGTPENLKALDLAAATLHASGLITAASGFTMSGGAFTVPNGALLKAALEKPHYNALLFSSNSGTVLGAGVQTTVPFNAEDADNKVGITSDLTNHLLTIARDGNYDIQFRFRVTDVQCNDYIPWIYIYDGTNYWPHRWQDMLLQVGNGGAVQVLNVPLKAGWQVFASHYSGVNTTRLGYTNDGGTADLIGRLVAMSLSVTEKR